jgi:hypothetical protein
VLLASQLTYVPFEWDESPIAVIFHPFLQHLLKHSRPSSQIEPLFPISSLGLCWSIGNKKSGARYTSIGSLFKC